MSFLGQTLPWPERLLPGRTRARTGVSALPRLWRAVSAGWQRLVSVRDARASGKRLRIVDKVLLGDKQFVALLEMDGKTFLASGGHGVPMSLTLAEGFERGTVSKRKAETKARKPAAERGGARAARPAAAGAGKVREKSARVPGAGKKSKGAPVAKGNSAGASASRAAKERAVEAKAGRAAVLGAKKMKEPRPAGVEPADQAKVPGKRKAGRQGESEKASGSAARKKPGVSVAQPGPAVVLRGAKKLAAPQRRLRVVGKEALTVPEERAFAGEGARSSAFAAGVETAAAAKKGSERGDPPVAGEAELARNLRVGALDRSPSPIAAEADLEKASAAAKERPDWEGARGPLRFAGDEGGGTARASSDRRARQSPAPDVERASQAGLHGRAGVAMAEKQADPRAQTAFAALLELRMLASEVFEEIEAHEGEPEGVAPEGVAHVGVGAARGPDLAEARKKGLAGSVSHRFRRRLSAFACFLVLVLAPHGTARAAILPVSPAVIPWTASPGLARAAPALWGGSSVDVLTLAAAAPRDEIRITGLGGSSASWSIVVVLTLLTLIPSLLFCITPFARLLIVFHFLRQALGLQTTPSNQTLIGLSLILTFFLMQPTGEQIYREAIVPAQAGAITPLDAVERAGGPMRHFMAHYVREKDAEMFLEIAKEPRPRSVEDLSFRVLLPAYILSELKAGFQIGTVLFLPFLIVDMVVASITTSVGMMQLPPVVISTPLKLLLFLMVDGWHLLIGALMRSFN